MTRDVPAEELERARWDGWLARNEGADYLHVRVLSDGRAVYLLPMLLGNLRVAIGPHGAMYFDDGWCYQAAQTDAAWRAALGWDGEDEPEGWYRHPETGRRRPDGIAAKEYVYG